MGISGKILIVDDEKEAVENCRRILTRIPFDCVVSSDPAEAIKLIERERPRLILTDLRMPKFDGIEVLTAAKRKDPTIQVVLLTAHATVETAVTAMRYGAFDYITKPFTSDELVQVVQRAFDVRAQNGGSVAPYLADTPLGRTPIQQSEENGPLVGNSAAMREVVKLIKRVAPTDSNVLVYGESGTGKELGKV